MPRNDQVIRQWHILRLLESSHGLTMQEMVDRLPTDYPRHQRTVRRDLEALEAGGFPIVNERADGAVRWRLMDGFHHVPAMSFSPTELMALVLSRSLLKPLEGTLKPEHVGALLADLILYVFGLNGLGGGEEVLHATPPSSQRRLERGIGAVFSRNGLGAVREASRATPRTLASRTTFQIRTRE